jgi:hypothetical protein
MKTNTSRNPTSRIARPWASALATLASLAAVSPGAAAAAELPEDVSAYYAVIQPVLEAKCWSCHGESKQKGKLRMDSFAAFHKGGDSGEAFVAGDPDNSEIWYRLTTDDEDDRMPPEDEEQLTDAEKAVIRWWIAQGADENKRAQDLERGEEIDTAIAEVLKAVGTQDPATLARRQEERAAREAAVQAKAENAVKVAAAAAELSSAIGVPILPIAQGEDTLQFTAVNVTDSFGDAEVAKLEPVATSLADVNLARTKVTDEGLALIGKMSGLRRLRLENTGVTDAGIAHLAGLQDLEYLNLYGTKVSDAAMVSLAGLKNLKRLYVWETGVTRAAADALVKLNPELVVNLGWNNVVPGPTPEEIEAAEAQRRAEAEAEKAAAEAKAKAEEQAKLAVEAEAKQKAAEEKQADAAAKRESAAQAAKAAEEAEAEAAKLAKEAEEAATKAKEAAEAAAQAEEAAKAAAAKKGEG